MSEFKRGDKVRITIEAEVASTSGDLLGYTYPLGEGVDYKSVGRSSAVTVELVAPAEWPPQPGDLWRDTGGELWFAFRDSGVVLMLPTYPSTIGIGGWEPDQVLDRHLLTLVHREESASTAQASSRTTCRHCGQVILRRSDGVWFAKDGTFVTGVCIDSGGTHDPVGGVS